MTASARPLKTRFATPEASLGFLLWKAANLLQQSHARRLADLGLTPSQCSLMLCLVHMAADGPATPTRIAAQSGMDKMLVSDLLATLQRKGFVRKTPNPEDRRSVLVAPTTSGQEVANMAVVRIEEDDERFFAQVGDAQALRSDLAGLVARHGRGGGPGRR